jgi:hypothetical protein
MQRVAAGAEVVESGPLPSIPPAAVLALSNLGERFNAWLLIFIRYSVSIRNDNRTVLLSRYMQGVGYA